MKTRIRKRMRLFLLEKEDIFQIKLFLLGYARIMV